MSSVLLAWIQAFTNALVPAMVALGLVWLRQHKVNTLVIEAVGRAAGEAYKQMVQSGASVTDRASLAAAVAEGRDYLLARIPDALTAAGVTPEGAAQMVSAELGKLLAVDPTVGLAVGSVLNSCMPGAENTAGAANRPASEGATLPGAAAQPTAVAPPA